MKLKPSRGLIAISASTALAFGVVGLIASPASAATSDCPSSDSCSWADASYVTGGHGNEYLGFKLYIPDMRSYYYNLTSIDATDSLTSAYNHGTSTVYYYDPVDPTASDSPEFLLTKSTGDGNVSNSEGYVQNEPNDTVSSGFFAAYAP